MLRFVMPITPNLTVMEQWDIVIWREYWGQKNEKNPYWESLTWHVLVDRVFIGMLRTQSMLTKEWRHLNIDSQSYSEIISYLKTYHHLKTHFHHQLFYYLSKDTMIGNIPWLNKVVSSTVPMASNHGRAKKTQPIIGFISITKW